MPGYYLKRARRPEEQHLPLAQYCLRVGGVLLALLLALDAYLPKLPVADREYANLPVIRIHSERKWPERIVFDTSLPASVPARIASSGRSRRRKLRATLPARRTGARPLRRCNHQMPGRHNRSIQKNGNQSCNTRAGSHGNTRRRITRRRRSGNWVGTVRVSGEEVSRYASVAV